MILTISSSATPVSFCSQSFPASGSFPISWLFRWPKYRSFSFSISPSNDYSGLISFRIDWFDLLSVQGTLKSLLQHHNSKALIVQHSAFLMVQVGMLGNLYWKRLLRAALCRNILGKFWHRHGLNWWFSKEPGCVICPRWLNRDHGMKEQCICMCGRGLGNIWEWFSSDPSLSSLFSCLPANCCFKEGSSESGILWIVIVKNLRLKIN